MKLRIEIVMENEAFEPENGVELARILRNVAAKIEGRGHVLRGTQVICLDINGNRVGHAKVS
jgi:hypothetical protein